MVDDDLSKIEAAISKSREEFLDADNQYNSEDAEKVMKEFVEKFLKEEADFSDTTREHANEVIEQDLKFNGMRASMAEKIAMAGLTLNGSILTLQRRIIEKGMDVFGPPPGTPGPMDPTKSFLARKKEMDARVKDFDSAGESAKKNAYDMGVYIDSLQKKATALIRLRTLTIKAFKTRNLEINLHDVI